MLTPFLKWMIYFSKFQGGKSSTKLDLSLANQQLRLDEESKKYTVTSAYGIGAALAHVMLDGAEKPIKYASRALTKAERN